MHEFYVNMLKRRDGRVYADLNKTDERIYFTAEAAQTVIDDEYELGQYRHVVKLVACLPHEVDDPHRDEWVALSLACEHVSTHCLPTDAQMLCDAIDRLSAAILGEVEFHEVELYYGKLDGGGKTPYFDSKYDLEAYLRTLLPGEDESKRYSRVFFHRFLKEKS